jgi:hypothetical protein
VSLGGETIEDMHLRELALRYKVVLLVALGATLWVVGQWAIAEANPLSGFWTGYAPLTSSPDLGLRPWVQAVLWLFLIAVWTVAALLLLHEPKSEPVETDDRAATGGDQ